MNEAYFKELNMFVKKAKILKLVIVIFILVLLVACMNNQGNDPISTNTNANDVVLESDKTSLGSDEQKYNEEEFMPKGYQSVKEARGDLNKDGIEDLVIIADEVTSNEDDFPNRQLLILFKDSDGKYKLSAKSDKAVLKQGEGGVVERDPLIDMKIENGVLTFYYWGGSRERWNSTYKFRFESGKWYLIGATEGWEDSLLEEGSESKDYNLITGKGVKIVTDKNGQETKYELEGEANKLINIEDFIPGGIINGIIKPKETIN